MVGASSSPRSLGRVLSALSALSVASFAGCSGFEGTTAASYINRTQSPDPNVRYRAYANLASPQCYDSIEQKKQAVQTLVEKLQSGREPVAARAVICRTLGALRDPDARPALLRSVDDPEALVRAEACRALGKVGQAEDANVLSRIMATDFLDCKVAALDALADLKPHDARVLQVLVEGMDHDFPAVRLASLNALREITNKDLGTETRPWRDYVQGLSAPAQPATDPATRQASDATASPSADRDGPKPPAPGQQGASAPPTADPSGR
jgi:HEAT repeat protein